MSNIALQVERTTDGSVANNAPVLFNNLILASGSISYNALSGEITISDPGRYQVEWWVAQQSGASGTNSVFGFTGPGVGTRYGNSPVKTGQTSGIVVFDVLEVPAVYTLNNVSGGTAYFNGDVPSKAQLIIVEDDDVVASDGGAIIPFASGSTPVALTSLLSGLAGLPSYIAFGNSIQDVNVLGASINLNDLANMSFSVPRDGMITSISAFFSTTASLTIIGTTVTVMAQLYANTTDDNIFNAVPGTAVSLSPALTGLVNLFTTARGTLDNLAIPVSEGTRLLMVFYINVTGLDLIQTVIGHASAGVSIV